MVTTDKVTVTEFAPHIGKTTTDYKENDMEIKATESGFNQTVQKDQATLIAELISRVTSLEDTVESILEQLQINTTENTDEIQSKLTSTVILFDEDGYARRYESEVFNDSNT